MKKRYTQHAIFPFNRCSCGNVATHCEFEKDATNRGDDVLVNSWCEVCYKTQPKLTQNSISNTEKGVEEIQERDYLIRYLRSKVFEIVQHYEPEALSNPAEVQKVMVEMVGVLTERYTQTLQTERKKREEMVKLELWCQCGDKMKHHMGIRYFCTGCDFSVYLSKALTQPNNPK